MFRVLVNICIVFSVIWITSCQKIETYPETPYIEFKEFHPEDSSITFSFIDGDGNIGMDQGDSIIVFDGDTIEYNLFTILYEKIDTIFEEVVFDDPVYFRIPNVEPQGQNKTLKGEINFKFVFYPLVIDTFRYEFYIYDNTLKRSNIVMTPMLTFNE